MTHMLRHTYELYVICLAPSAGVLSIGLSRRVRRNASCSERSHMLLLLLLALPASRNDQGLADVGL